MVRFPWRTACCNPHRRLKFYENVDARQLSGTSHRCGQKGVGLRDDATARDAHVGVYALNRGWTIPFGPVDQNQLHQALADLNAQGSTPLGAAMKVAADALLKAREQQTYGSYRLVIVSDGEATDGNLVRSYLPAIQQRGITIDVIGVSMDRKHSLATEVDRYREANDHDALVQAMEESLAEMSDDNQDTDEAADFSLLQGLPDDVTVALIDTLSRPNNEPISKSRADAKPKVFLPRPSPSPSPSRKPNDVPKKASAEEELVSSLLRLIICVLLLCFFRIVPKLIRASLRRTK
jgi:uncharacterized protein YegL